MNSSNNKYSKELIEMRRLKVLELISKATSQCKIAEQLGVSQATVSLDLQYVKCKSQEKMKTHVEDRIPMQYEECQTGLKLILRKTYEILEDKSKRTEEQLTAMNLAVNIYGKLMDLSTNGAILEKTTKWINELKQRSQERLQPAKISGLEEKQEEDEERTPTPTEPGEDLREE
jgi:predicted transcriptional regulator